jgi:hypothetical protein
MGAFRVQATSRNFALSAVLGVSLVSLVATMIWLHGIPWNLYWWVLIGGAISVGAVVPFLVPVTTPTILLSALAGLIATVSAFEYARALKDVEANTPPIPVIKVDAEYPTRDKPQSKLWFAHDSWWGWFPDGGASSIWRRGDRGWKRETSLDVWLESLPGRADVWLDGENVHAVLVSEATLSVALITFDSEIDGYRPSGTPFIWQIPDTSAEEPIESATIVKDGNGTWWIVYDYRNAIWARYAKASSALTWSHPLKLSEPIALDDIGIAFPMPGAIGVMWAHQSGEDEEQIYFRRHLDGNAPDQWEPAEVIDRGYEVAEDHFNAAVASNGHVYVATKDDENTIDQPQLVLRDIHPDGSWVNIPYADRTEAIMPTRPIALVGGDPQELYLVHSYYPQGTSPRGEDYIVFRKTDLTASLINSEDQILIPPKKGRYIRNATSTKNELPVNAPWIILASDKQGNIYEGIVRGLAGD